MSGPRPSRSSTGSDSKPSSRGSDEFLVQHIDSVHTLEVLLLLYHRPTESVSVDAVHRALHTGRPATEGSLKRLLAHGFLERSGNPETFRYRPRNAEIRRLTAELANAYSARPTSVIRAIHEPRKQ